MCKAVYMKLFQQNGTQIMYAPWTCCRPEFEADGKGAQCQDEARGNGEETEYLYKEVSIIIKRSIMYIKKLHKPRVSVMLTILRIYIYMAAKIVPKKSN